LRRFRAIVPVPAVMVRVAGTLTGSAVFKQLMSLFMLMPMRTEADLQRLGIVLRPLPSGMTRSGDTRRRELIREGRAFLIYVLKASPSSAVLRRYVRAVESLRDGRALPLPESVLRLPWGMLLLDTPATRSAPRGDEFFWRLHAAVALGEASMQGAVRFLGVGKPTGMTSAGWRVMRAGFQELGARALRFSAAPLLRLCWRSYGLLP
jgi:NADH dehydrogenase